MKSLSKIFSIFIPLDIRRCLVLWIAMLLGAGLEAVGIGAIMPLLAFMGQPDFLEHHEAFAQKAAIFGITTHTQLIMGAALLLLVLYILKNVYLLYLSKFQVRFALWLQNEYAKRLFAIYLNKPYLYHLEHNTATLLHRTYNGPQTVFMQIFLITLYFLTEVFTATAICMFLFWADTAVSAIVISCFGGMVYAVLRFFRGRIRRQGEAANSCSKEMFQWVNQGLGAIKETKVLGKEPHFYAMYDAASRKFCKANEQYRIMAGMPRFVIESIVVTGLLLLIVGEIFAGQSPTDIMPLLGLLAMAAFRLMPSANRIIGYWNSIKFQMPLLEELYEDLLLVRESRVHGLSSPVFQGAPVPMSFEHGISIRHLSFRYPETEWEVLRDVSFEIPKGSFVGIVGESGAGKTTFVDLFLGLLSPTGGQFLVDGIPMDENVRAWQANLAYVPQEIYLLDSTIRENIALGLTNEEIDEARIIQVLQMAEMDTFVQALPEGVNTVVGERGVKLSGGQRQRIGIARALYHQTKVLVLDEATSALDDATEKSITDTILKFKGKLTIIAVAHRLSTLADCDFKVRFENGQATIVDDSNGKMVG